MWLVSLMGGGDTCNSDQDLPSTLLGFKCVVFMLSLCAGFFVSVMLGWIVPLQLSLLSVLFFTSLSGEGELGPANDERYVQKAISTIHQEQNQYVGHCHGSEPLASISFSSESVQGCARETSIERRHVTGMCTGNRWPLPDGVQQDQGIAGMLLFTCHDNCTNSAGFPFLVYFLLAIPGKATFLKSILIRPSGIRPITQTLPSDWYINPAWWLSVENAVKWGFCAGTGASPRSVLIEFRCFWLSCWPRSKKILARANLVPYSLVSWQQLDFLLGLNNSMHTRLPGVQCEPIFLNVNIGTAGAKSYVWCARNSQTLFHCLLIYFFLTLWAFSLPAWQALSVVDSGKRGQGLGNFPGCNFLWVWRLGVGNWVKPQSVTAEHCWMHYPCLHNSASGLCMCVHVCAVPSLSTGAVLHSSVLVLNESGKQYHLIRKKPRITTLN